MGAESTPFAPALNMGPNSESLPVSWDQILADFELYTGSPFWILWPPPLSSLLVSLSSNDLMDHISMLRSQPVSGTRWPLIHHLPRSTIPTSS
jgi:hypothetical protein